MNSPTLPTLPKRIAKVPLFDRHNRCTFCHIELLQDGTTPVVIPRNGRIFLKCGDREWHETTVGRALD